VRAWTLFARNVSLCIAVHTLELGFMTLGAVEVIVFCGDTPPQRE
jgi:hypothetical protein